MRLHPPFIISAHLAPALRIGDGVLSLIAQDHGERIHCTFALDAPTFNYIDKEFSSGRGHDWTTVELFEGFLGFMEACAEGRSFEQRNPGMKSDNSGLFPPHVGEWLTENQVALQLARIEICDPDDDGKPNNNLIEE